MTTESAAPRALRADAARNRDKLLQTAVDAFTEYGRDVPLESIAARAGVGVGTLYRHFPSRTALIQAIYRLEVDRLCSPPTALLAEHCPEVALQAWMNRFVEYAATKRVRSEELSPAALGQPLPANTRAQLLAALGTLIDAAVVEGAIRADADAEDVLRALGAVWLIGDAPQERDQARRLVGLLMDGLRYGAPRSSR